MNISYVKMTTYLTIAICLTLLHATQQEFQNYERYCPNGQHCYITPSHRSWSNAQQWCKSMNSTLPVVDTLEKQAALVEAMKSMGLTEVWIGATAVYDDWTWVDGTKLEDNVTLSVTPEDFVAGMFKLDPGVVVPYGSPAIYVGFSICQYSNPEACNETEHVWKSVSKENGCNVVYYNLLSWFSARNHCLENEGDLATFHNLSDAVALVDYNQPMPWVGLRNRWWNWHNAVTGTSEEVLFTQWSLSEPRNTKGFDCISTTSNGWKETNCAQNLAFICQQQNSVFLPDKSTVSSNNGGEFTAQIGSCKNVGIAAGLGVGIPLIVIATIIIVVIIKRDKLRTQKKPVSSTMVYEKRSPNNNESVADSTRNIQPEQTKEGGAYEGLDSSQREADDDAYEALDMQ